MDNCTYYHHLARGETVQCGSVTQAPSSLLDQVLELINQATYDLREMYIRIENSGSDEIINILAQNWSFKKAKCRIGVANGITAPRGFPLFGGGGGGLPSSVGTWHRMEDKSRSDVWYQT